MLKEETDSMVCSCREDPVHHRQQTSHARCPLPPSNFNEPDAAAHASAHTQTLARGSLSPCLRCPATHSTAATAPTPHHTTYSTEVHYFCAAASPRSGAKTHRQSGWSSATYAVGSLAFVVDWQPDAIVASTQVHAPLSALRITKRPLPHWSPHATPV